VDRLRSRVVVQCIVIEMLTTAARQGGKSIAQGNVNLPFAPRQHVALGYETGERVSADAGRIGG
jgi:hypothetical protein